MDASRVVNSLRSTGTGWLSARFTEPRTESQCSGPDVRWPPTRPAGGTTLQQHDTTSREYVVHSTWFCVSPVQSFLPRRRKSVHGLVRRNITGRRRRTTTSLRWSIVYALSGGENAWFHHEKSRANGQEWGRRRCLVTRVDWRRPLVVAGLEACANGQRTGIERSAQ